VDVGHLVEGIGGVIEGDAGEEPFDLLEALSQATFGIPESCGGEGLLESGEDGPSCGVSFGEGLSEADELGTSFHGKLRFYGASGIGPSPLG